MLDVGDVEEALDTIRDIWSMTVNFLNVKDIGPLPQEELAANGWTLASKSAYPSAIVTDPDEEEDFRLPTSEEMESLSAVTYALAMFFKENRKRIKEHARFGVTGRALKCNATLFREDCQIPVSISIPAPEYISDLIGSLGGLVKD